jgi:L-lactate permease
VFKVHHQHGNKINRPIFVRGQSWVSLALTISKGFRSLGIPILSRLARRGGNSGKLVAARTLLRFVAPLFQGLQTFLLMDSWYMRCNLITYAMENGLAVIGQDPLLSLSTGKCSFHILSSFVSLFSSDGRLALCISPFRFWSFNFA